MPSETLGGFCQPVDFKLEVDGAGLSWIVLQDGRRYQNDKDAFATREGAYLYSTHPGQPPRQLAGEGKAFEDAVLLVALVVALIGLTRAIFQEP